MSPYPRACEPSRRSCQPLHSPPESKAFDVEPDSVVGALLAVVLAALRAWRQLGESLVEFTFPVISGLSIRARVHIRMAVGQFRIFWSVQVFLVHASKIARSAHFIGVCTCARFGRPE
jgi:hypothetical protein